MASKPPGTPRLKSHARTSSFDSGSKKCLNGEAAHKSIPERRSSRPAHVEKRMLSGRGVEAQDDHNKVKEQLAMIERSKSNLMQDLVRAKRNVEELTTKLNGVNGACKKEKVHAVEGGTAHLEKEGWQIELEAMKQQYDLALLELQTSKQAMESLKHELMVCVEAKDEAVRLAGEAMSAAESTARRVEELSAELFTTKGSALGDDCTTGGMNDLMGDLPGDSLLEIEVPLRSITHKERLIPTGGGSKEGDVTESLITKPPEANIEDEKVQPVQSKEVETKHDVLAFSLKALQRELAAAKEAEKKATNSILSMQADMERARLEAEKFKSAESVAQASLAKVSRELEEAEKKLAKASIEDATRAESLESFSADLEKSRHEAMQALDRETSARNKATEALDCMEKMREAYQAELLMCKEREASARATVESLQKDFERQKSESTILAERELKMRESYQAELSMRKAKEASACAMVESLQKDLDRQKSDSSIEAEKELKMRESYQMELSMCKEREASACAMVESLQMDLEKQKAESTMVAAKISEMIKELERSRTELIEQQKHSSCEIVALSSKLEANQAKLAALEERESCSATRIAGLMLDVDKKQAEVDHLQCRLSKMEMKAEAESSELSSLRENNLKLAELMVKEQESSAKLNTLNMEVVSLKQALEEALNAGKAARDELCKVESALQNAISERDQTKCEVQAAYHQLELSKQLAEDALSEAKAAKDEAERALCAEREASNAAKEALLASTKLAKEAQMAREEAHATKDKLQAALKNSETASMELERVMKEAQSAREDAKLQKAALAAEKERANSIEDEAQEVLIEVSKLRAELTKLQADAMEAVAAKNAAEHRLHVAMEQLQAHQSREKEVDKSQEEIAILKEKLRLYEEQLEVMTSDAKALQSSRLELMQEVEAAKVEKEASQRALVDAHQHLADMEKAKRVMEADIQKLLDDSKQWRTPRDTRDILALSEINGLNGYVLVADCRDEKPQPDSPDRNSFQSLNATYLHINGEKRGEEMAAEKEENEAPIEETPIRAGKKKKHALLYRLHSYLDKKKIPHAP